uniref:Uncharacterized protein n=1 Tax=Calidris pygmaea TaxID=425635 RepID=A0A8C3JFC1_9CHAR
MAARTLLEMLQDEVRCSICLGIFQDPVSIYCGHSFCRSCITEAWEGLSTNFSCPQCRETGDQKILRPNWELAEVIEAAKSDACRGPNRVRGMGGEGKSMFPPKAAAVSLTLSPPPAQMTLDPQTASPWLYLSEDCKLVRWEHHEQDLPSNPKRFKVKDCVLGLRGFTSGWHRWDVEVHGQGTWAIGVAKESVPRNRDFDLNPNEGVWALCHILNGYQALTSPCATPLTLRRVPKWIRICLDYEEGRVVFFDAESKERIFAFPPASFQEERVFLLFMVIGDAQLKLLP